MRLIDADKLRQKFIERIQPLVGKDCSNERHEYMSWLRSVHLLDDMPTADTERHGHWEIDIDTGCEMYKCSVCECRMIKKDYDIACGTNALRYCPYCGAKMDEVEEER